jgi:hypothetical protein
MTTFQSYLLRYVSLGTLLKAGPKFWEFSPVSSPEGQSDWYSLSTEATHGYVEYFVSHTWRSNAFMKHVAMAYFINGPAAMKVGHAVAILTFMTCLFLKLFFNLQMPHVVMYSPCSHSCDMVSSSFFCTLCGGSAQLLVLVFGHHLPKIVSGARKSCFVDKCCVSQTNEKLKQEAIYSFDGILSRTNNMLILWDNDYFERLWCAFEVASFSRHRGIDNFNFMPIILGVFAVAMTVVNTGGIWGIYLIHALADPFMKKMGDPYTFFMFWALLGTLVFWWPKFLICSMLAEGRQLIMEQLRTFDVQKTKCFDEADRNFVESHIVEWFGSLEKFNDVVQKGLTDVLEHSLGSKWQATPYRTILFYSGNILWVLGLDGLLVARGWSECLTVVIFSCGCYFVMNPLFFYCANVLAQLSMSPPCSNSTRIIVRIVGVIILGFWWPLWYICCVNSSHWVSGSLFAVGAVLVTAAYRKPAPARCRRTQSTKEFLEVEGRTRAA